MLLNIIQFLKQTAKVSTTGVVGAPHKLQRRWSQILETVTDLEVSSVSKA